MLIKSVASRLEEIITPARNEVRQAQELALQRIQAVMLKAEEEVADEGRFMTQEQRSQSAEKELEKAEAHLLSALGSMYKAVCYIVPSVNPLSHLRPIKEIKAELLSKE